jgi:Tfp pilus assembly protein PilX
MTIHECPVARLGAETQAITDTITRLQAESHNAPAHARSALRDRERDLNERLDALTAAAAYEVATSLDGALFQLMLMRSLADGLNGQDDDEAERTMRQIDSLAYAIARTFEAHGADREQVNGEYYMSRRFDPHSVVETQSAA